MKWDRLKLFNIVVQTGNITHASSILNISAIAKEISSKVMKQIINTEVNRSNVSAIVDDVIKRKMENHL